MSFTLPFLLDPVFFRTALPCCGGYHLERGGINCKQGATTENQKIKAQVSSIWAKECISDDCVCVIRLDMTIAHWWREKIIVY